MPVVPRNLGRVQGAGLGTPYQGLSTSGAEFGALDAEAVGNFGKLAGQAGGVMSSLAQKRREEQDAIDLQGARNDAARQIDEYVATGSNAVLGRKLGAARGSSDETSKYLDELGGKAMEGLSPRLHKAFTLEYANTVGRTLHQVGLHEQSEHEHERASTLKDTYETQLNRVSATPDDPAVFEDAVRLLDSALIVGVDDAGLRQRARDEMVSTMHLKVIDGVGVEDPEAALKYLHEHLGEIEGIKHAEVREELGRKTAALRKELEKRVGERIPFALADEAEAVGGDLEQMGRYIDDYVRTGDTTPEEAAKAVSILKGRMELRDKSVDLAIQQRLDGARDAMVAEIAAAKKSGAAPQDIDAIVSLSDQAELAGTEKWGALVKFYEGQRNGEEAVTTPAAREEFHQLRMMAIGIDPNTGEPNPELIVKVKQMNTNDLRTSGQWGEADLKALETLQIDLFKGQLSEEKKRSMRTIGQARSVLTRGLQKVAEDPRSSMTITRQQERIGQRFDDAVETYRSAHDGKDPDHAELNRITDQLVFDPVEPNSLYQKLTPRTDAEVAGVAGVIEMPIVGGKPLSAGAFGGMGRAITSANGLASLENIVSLAEAMALAGNNPNAYYTDAEYLRIWTALKTAEGR